MAKQTTLKRMAENTVFKKFKTDPAFKGPKKTPKFEPLPIPTMDGSDPVLTALIKRLGGDSSLAKRILSLQEKYPVGTIPELLCYDWLMAEGLKFEYQVELYGGRGYRGGLIPDFLLYRDGTNGDIWQVQGDYFHSVAKKGFRDQTMNYRMLGQIVNGVTVARVIELWESDLYRLRPQIFYWALAGMSARG